MIVCLAVICCLAGCTSGPDKNSAAYQSGNAAAEMILMTADTQSYDTEAEQRTMCDEIIDIDASDRKNALAGCMDMAQQRLKSK